jgi:hypothetical protein
MFCAGSPGVVKVSQGFHVSAYRGKTVDRIFRRVSPGPAILGGVGRLSWKKAWV